MTASPAMLRRARPAVSATREIEPESAPPQPKEGPLSRAVRLIIAIERGGLDRWSTEGILYWNGIHCSGRWTPA